MRILIRAKTPANIVNGIINDEKKQKTAENIFVFYHSRTFFPSDPAPFTGPDWASLFSGPFPEFVEGPMVRCGEPSSHRKRISFPLAYHVGLSMCHMFMPGMLIPSCPAQTGHPVQSWKPASLKGTSAATEKRFIVEQKAP